MIALSLGLELILSGDWGVVVSLLDGLEIVTFQWALVDFSFRDNGSERWATPGLRAGTAKSNPRGMSEDETASTPVSPFPRPPNGTDNAIQSRGQGNGAPGPYLVPR